MIKRALHIFSWLLLSTSGIGQEVPKIIHFTRQDYQAQNQNWDIAQGNDLQIFIGNSSGVLSFDGVRWKLFTVPSDQIIRAVECDSTGRVFVGGFETMGYWEMSKNGQFAYYSLIDMLGPNGLGNEEIWHILLLKDKVLFQSFSTIYLYDYQSVKAIRPPGNIMFSRWVNGDILVPVISEGLFEFRGDSSFQKISNSDIFNKMLISDILPYGTSELLVCTQNEGVFRYSNGKFSKWEMPINKELIKMQLNKGLRLQDGGYAFGTILGGIYITDGEGEVVTTINQESGLQNNTVLSLFQDYAGQLWAGLDNGIDQLLLDSPLQFFQDKTGEIGTVYAAAIFEENLYLGTNHGVFYKKYPSSAWEKWKLINGSQGQVWDLQVFDDQLVGGHNAGTMLIKNGEVDFIFTGTGVYSTVRHPTKPDVLLQGTYTGVITLRQQTTGHWDLANGIGGFSQSARKLLFDQQGRLWVLHSRKGLFRLKLDDNLQKAVEVESFREEHGLPSLFQLDMCKVGEEIVFKSGHLFFTWDDEQGHFVKKEKIGTEPLSTGNFLLQGGHDDDWFKIYPNQVKYYNGEGNAIFHLSLVKRNERIILLPGGNYLFCLDDGYAMLSPKELKTTQPKTPAKPLLTGLTIGKNKTRLDGLSPLSQPFIFDPSENQLTFQFACPNFTFQPAMRHRLLGFEEKWSPFQTVYSKEFTNLPPGNYSFEVQSELSDEVAEFRFTIKPKWFQTGWAKAIYSLFILGAFSFLLKWHERRMRAQKQRLEQEKEKELEQQRTQARNEMLQAEILNKSRKLADTTINLVRKNEMLLAIKDELEQATNRKNKAGSPAKSLSKMEHLIDQHLTSEEDWQVFEANFNQLHDQFFKRLKDQYPDLTPGDLRLAAYLKMNLSSKEIAPLLNISVRGVENKRYRLRHKMGLEGEVNLTEYLMGY